MDHKKGRPNHQMHPILQKELSYMYWLEAAFFKLIFIIGFNSGSVDQFTFFSVLGKCKFVRDMHLFRANRLKPTFWNLTAFIIFSHLHSEQRNHKLLRVTRIHKDSYSNMKRTERQSRLYAFVYGDNSQYFLPCKTLTATTCASFFVDDTGHFEVSVTSISSLCLKVAL